MTRRAFAPNLIGAVALSFF